MIHLQRKSNSLSGGEGVSDDSSGGPVERLRAWVEGYEAAVTNHYSPELRARVHAARINGVSPDLRASTQGAVLGHRCRVTNNPRPLFDVFDSKVGNTFNLKSFLLLFIVNLFLLRICAVLSHLAPETYL